ncbi:MAG: sugar phosphate nucleotidyltransferase [Actinomycetes bacterium]
MDAIILVGGRGTRLRPLTVTTPKPLLPVAGRPFIDHQLDRLRNAGVTHVVLATSYQPDVFAAYAGTQAVPGLDIECVTEVQPLGTGGGIRNVAARLRAAADEPVVVLNGDVVSDHDIARQLAEHQRVDAAVTLHLTVVDDARPFGCVPTAADGRVEAFIEKSDDPPTNQINAGCYVFRRSVIDDIPTDRPVSVERETFPGLLEAGARLQGYVEASYWLDIGTPAAYLRANCDLVQRDGDALVAADARVMPNASVTGGSVLSPAVTVASGAVIERSVVLDGASVGEGARVVSSVIGRFVRVGPDAVLEDAVIGDGARIGSRNELRAGMRIWPDTQIADGTIRFSSDV